MGTHTYMSWNFLWIVVMSLCLFSGSMNKGNGDTNELLLVPIYKCSRECQILVPTVMWAAVCNGLSYVGRTYFPKSAKAYFRAGE